MVAIDKTYTPQEINSLMDVIDTYRRWKQFSQRNDRSYAHYHPSEWGKCLRMQQYKHYAWIGALGEVEYSGFDSKKLRLFDKGHNMHARWSNYFDDIGGVLLGKWRCKNPLCYMFNDLGERNNTFSLENLYAHESRTHNGKDNKPIFRPEKCVCGCKNFEYLETQVSAPELNIKGHADLVLNFDGLKEDRFKGVRTTFNSKFLPMNGKKIVGDMKTASSKSWKNQLIAKGPHKEYLVQLTIYVHILGCDYGIIMYENKDDSTMLWYKVPRNDKWWEIVQYQAKTMIEMAKAKPKRKLPPPKYDSKRNYGCMYCDFKKVCQKSKIWDHSNFDKIRRNFYKSLL